MKKVLVAIALVACLVGFVSPAKAITIGWDQLIGTVDPAAPADVAIEVQYVNQLIALANEGTKDLQELNVPDTPQAPYIYDVNDSFAGPFPLPVAADGAQYGYTNLSFNLTSGADYLLAKFGNQAAIYWLDGLSGDITLVSPFPTQGGGLSHITLFNQTSVPEPATMLLLGLGLLGVAGARRKFKK